MNLPLILFLLVLFTGFFWVAERLYFAPKRRLSAEAALADLEQRQAQNTALGLDPAQANTDKEQLRQRLLQPPWWIEWTAGLFGVILLVFVLRSFLGEPFNIPSGSMKPTLQVGDFILVDKISYGAKLPIIDRIIWRNHAPQRGDIAVFRFPIDPSQDYIKRIVGLPGDTIEYFDKKLSINGIPVVQQEIPNDGNARVHEYLQTLGNVTFHIYNDDSAPPGVHPTNPDDRCEYTMHGVRCVVPEGHYFMMGDNRDDSLDSRYWGFVPERYIVGRAFLVWINFNDFGRIGFVH